MAVDPLEGEILPSSSNADVRPPKLSREDPKKGSRSINVSRRVQELGADPIEILAYIAMGDNASLGTDEEIRIFERRAASTELLSYMAPKQKAKEFVDTEEEFTPILEYAPKRGEKAQKRLEILGEMDNDDN